jgi:hypothetical protein
MLEQAKSSFPYEYISWDDWTSLDPPRKVTLIEEHNNHINEFQLKISTGCINHDDVLMGEKPQTMGDTDYSELTINQFILTKYKIGNPPIPIFHQAWGPIFGIPQFIILEQNKDIAEILIQKLKVDFDSLYVSGKCSAGISGL